MQRTVVFLSAILRIRSILAIEMSAAST